MAKSDESHYELVLGNRQLVSGFFVLVILFAIFLTLGYILGRNSVVVSEPATVSGAGKPDAGETRIAESSSPARTHSASEASTERPSAAVSAPVEPPPVAAKPQSAAPEPSAAKPAVTSATAASTARSQEILSGKVKVITPRTGDVFLQVAAISRTEAEVMGEQLQKRGHRVFLSEVPTKDLFRVLIGPFDTTARLNEVKKKLADEGLPSIVQRY